MTTGAKILRAIAHAVELANKPTVRAEDRERTFVAALAGTLDACGPEAEVIANQVFALGQHPAAAPAPGA